jgi:hypothetical protein
MVFFHEIVIKDFNEPLEVKMTMIIVWKKWGRVPEKNGG